MADHQLLLVRHAQAADFVPGLKDHQRPLTGYGIEQATAVGTALQSHGVRIDRVLCSSAIRTRQTCDALGLDAVVEYSDDLYNAGSETILESVRLLAETIGTAMIIGHGPGLPTLAMQLAGPGSDQQGLDVINSRYPVATVSDFEIDGPWADLQSGRLSWLRIGA